MKWDVVVRPEVETDILTTAEWYEHRQLGLGEEFKAEVLLVFDALIENPLLNCRRHPSKNIRWRYPNRFPYRVIYEVLEEQHLVVVAAVLHAARHDQHWQKRLK